ncbi:glutathione synthase [Chryseobacterium artocarpi]|uniref:Glutathione synthase n=1 Tax=Chryseobacterium artocarpi TaxID=1414727 RepID=A0A1B8ZGE2_9FLAO|nr:glutathione synthase [Chryseobacterium artocarpi]OCA70680.1 glutathione synthase [Chryseobacterium artocarpi]
MSHKNFTTTDFTENSEKQYQIEFKINEIGEGINLIVQKLNEKGEYEMIQAPVHRLNDSIFITWDHPFDGRILFDE